MFELQQIQAMTCLSCCLVIYMPGCQAYLMVKHSHSCFQVRQKHPDADFLQGTGKALQVFPTETAAQPLKEGMIAIDDLVYDFRDCNDGALPCIGIHILQRSFFPPPPLPLRHHQSRPPFSLGGGCSL